MSIKHGFFIVLVIVTLLVAACGPEMATPTPADEVTADSSSPPKASAGETPVGEAPESRPTSAGEEPEPAGELPVDADDWHVLGSPEAPVTIIEYSDFQ
jgi:protein-disulfide isomerase